MVELGGQHDRARRVHRRDHGDERQQSLPGGQQVADVGDDGQRAGADREPARPSDGTDVGPRDEHGDGDERQRRQLADKQRPEPAVVARAVEEHEQQAEPGAGEDGEGDRPRRRRPVGSTADAADQGDGDDGDGHADHRQQRRSLAEGDAGDDGHDGADDGGDRRHHRHRPVGEGEVEGGDRGHRHQAGGHAPCHVRAAGERVAGDEHDRAVTVALASWVSRITPSSGADRAARPPQ